MRKDYLIKFLVLTLTIMVLSTSIQNVKAKENPYELEKNFAETYLSEIKGYPIKVGNGICGSVAAAIMLIYQDDYERDSYVPTSLESETALINELVPHIDGLVPGSNQYDVYKGINSYLIEHNTYYKSADYSTYSISAVKTQINQDDPAIVGLNNHPTYGDHWVVAYGVLIDVNGPDYSIVNDGWGHTGINISGYTDYIVYMD